MSAADEPRWNDYRPTLSGPPRVMRIGDVVRTHGMLCLVDRAPERGCGHDDNGGVWWTAALVLNPESATGPDGIVPRGWLYDPDRWGGEPRWVLQCNDLGAYDIHRPDLGAYDAMTAAGVDPDDPFGDPEACDYGTCFREATTYLVARGPAVTLANGHGEARPMCAAHAALARELFPSTYPDR